MTAGNPPDALSAAPEVTVPPTSPDLLVELLRRCLQKGAKVEIDGLGTFQPHGNSLRFVAQQAPRIFIAYAFEDLTYAQKLYDACTANEWQPWLDRQKLLPGQNWPRAIERAITLADFFVPLFSQRSIRKRGAFQSELRFALDCATARPLNESFILPVRLDRCEVPQMISCQTQYVDLFPDWDTGWQRLQAAIRVSRPPS